MENLHTDPLKEYTHKELYQSDKYKVWVMNGFLYCYKKERDQFNNAYWTGLNLEEYLFLIEELIKHMSKKEEKKENEAV